MLILLKRWIQRAASELKRAKVLSLLAGALLIDVAKGLLEHQIYGTLLDVIHERLGSRLSYVEVFLRWFIATPFSVLALCVAIILLHAYWKSLPQMREHSESLVAGRLNLEGKSVTLPREEDNFSSRQNVLNRIKSEKLARIGFVHYPPFVVAAGDDLDEPTGLYVELIREFLQSQEITARFEQVRFSSAVECITKDEQDIVLSIFETPRRTRFVDFTAFMHKVSVSGVVRHQENRIHSESDLVTHSFRFVVFRDEIGHEILEDQLKIPSSRLNILDGPDVSTMFGLVVQKSVDVAIADSLSCYHGLAARGAEGPKLKAVLRRSPLYLCPNGVMIARNQRPLAQWLDSGLKETLRKPRFAMTETAILDEYHGIITKM